MYRTQVFKDSLAHGKQPSYYIKLDPYWQKIRELQGQVRSDEEVPNAIAEFWTMVGQEMQTGHYFKIV